MRNTSLLICGVVLILAGCQSLNDSQEYSHHPDDIQFLQDLIDVNGLTENSSDRDKDNGDGTLTPLEVGHQTWWEKRLIGLTLGSAGFDSTRIYYEIENFPESIGNLSHLRWLYLGYMNLDRLPDKICQLESLETLFLWGNNLTGFPERIGEMRSLERIQAGANSITSLPPSIVELVELQSLGLWNSKLQYLPEGFENLTNLESLFLGSNLLVELPDGIGNLEKMTFLNLDDNQLETLPESIINFRLMRYLGYMGVRNNKLYCVDGVQDTNLIPSVLRQPGISREIHGLYDQDCTK